MGRTIYVKRVMSKNSCQTTYVERLMSKDYVERILSNFVGTRLGLTTLSRLIFIHANLGRMTTFDWTIFVNVLLLELLMVPLLSSNYIMTFCNQTNTITVLLLLVRLILVKLLSVKLLSVKLLSVKLLSVKLFIVILVSFELLSRHSWA